MHIEIREAAFIYEKIYFITRSGNDKLARYFI